MGISLLIRCRDLIISGPDVEPVPTCVCVAIPDTAWFPKEVRIPMLPLRSTSDFNTDFGRVALAGGMKS